MGKKLCYVVSGPSGAGKSTLIKLAAAAVKSVGVTVSCTTRSPRPSERDGMEYHFISHKRFEELIKDGEFIEHVECFGNRYGTIKNAVSDVLLKKNRCIMDLDFDGAYKVLEDGLLSGIECVGVLILPPSIKSLQRRLTERNSDGAAALRDRLENSFNCEKIARYEHVIINDDIQNSSRRFNNILAG
ncbi:MAG: guanylate kinase [Holosporales bacterium]|jgi:guanylate kinase|nr:guanylate kinase [Holosporales bacterium]